MHQVSLSCEAALSFYLSFIKWCYRSRRIWQDIPLYHPSLGPVDMRLFFWQSNCHFICSVLIESRADFRDHQSTCVNIWEMLSYSCFNVQEIKFDPSVMCEPIDKQYTFRSSQVLSYIFFLCIVSFVLSVCRFWLSWWCFTCSLKMEILSAFKNLLQLKAVNTSNTQMFLHFWITFTLAKYVFPQLFLNVFVGT